MSLSLPATGRAHVRRENCGHNATSIVDVLDRVLDKGLAVAGDVRFSIAEVELLTIRIRLMICSIDKAQEIGLDWWKYDRHLFPRSRDGVPDDVRKRFGVPDKSASPSRFPASLGLHPVSLVMLIVAVVVRGNALAGGTRDCHARMSLRLLERRVNWTCRAETARRG
jgi:hypothetical protein